MNKSFWVAFAAISTLFLGSCSDDKTSSTPPLLGSIAVSPAHLYTGQKATVAVSFSDLGSHVYFSSSDCFTSQINEKGRNTDSIPVFKDKDLRIPQNFSYSVTLPLSPGIYSLTFRTPSVNKSATSSEGESILFPPLTKQTSITVLQADAINANFGDTREMVTEYINVNDTTFTGSEFDAAGKASAKTTANGFTRQIVYKFKSNKLTEVDDERSYSISGIIRDESGIITGATITDDDVIAIKNNVNFLFTERITEELLPGDKYDPETAMAKYGILADEDDNAKWKTFLTDLVAGTVKSYTFQCHHAKSDALITVVLTAKDGIILITNKFTK